MRRINFYERDNHLLINASPVEGMRFLMEHRPNLQVDLTVIDPDYSKVHILLDTDFYKNVCDVVKIGCPVLHFTCNDKHTSKNSAREYRIVNELVDKYDFCRREPLTWQKYKGQKLIPTKLPWSKFGMPNDIDRILIFLKNRPGCNGPIPPPGYVDYRKLHKNQTALLSYPADQKSQFKPLDLFKDLVAALCPKNGIVLDTHMGGANLLRVSLPAGQTYIGIEPHEGLFNDACKCLRRDGNWAPIREILI